MLRGAGAIAFVVAVAAGFAVQGGAAPRRAAVVPQNTSRPTITGIAQDGQILKAASGTWTSSTTITYAYQWLRCDSTGAACGEITGSTSKSRQLTSADVAHTVRVRVTATNADGSSAALSRATGIVQARPPVNTTLPLVSGTLRDGQIVGTTAGTWTGSTPMTFRYQWQSCDATGSACADIAGKTASKMQLKSSDVGRTVRVRVTADNSALPGGGRVSATSAASGLIQALPPTNTAVPTISGTLEDGAKLTATKGSWKGSTPRLYSYAWQRCDATGAACIDIPGATDRILVLGAADVGRTARVRVTADNSALPGGGTASARSAATAPIVSVITGVAQQGHALAASGGSFTYQWLRCDAVGSACSAITNGTARTYSLVAGDVGHAIRVRATPTATGSAQTSSRPTVAVFAPAGRPCGTLAGAARPATYKHVIWIWFENKNYSEIIGNPDAAYFNTIANACGLAKNFYSVAHVSRRDYIAATGGVIRPPIGTSVTVDSGYDATAPSIFDRGETWKAYMESMDENCDPRGNDDDLYEHGHNPPLFYGAVADACQIYDVPMGTSAAGALVNDLRNGTLPAFSFVKPNGCNDMHNLCGGKTVSDMIKRGDAWLKTWIELIAASPGYSKGDTAIFVTFDEGEVTTNPSNLEEDCMQTLSETCHIATVVVTPYLNAASSSTFYSTYSLLKTTEEMLGLSPLLGHAADASTASMRPGLGF